MAALFTYQERQDRFSVNSRRESDKLQPLSLNAVVYQDVDGVDPEAGQRLAEERADVFDFGNVARARVDASAARGRGAFQRADPGRAHAPSDGDDARALAAELRRQEVTHPARGARDDDDAPLDATLRVGVGHEGSHLEAATREATGRRSKSRGAAQEQHLVGQSHRRARGAARDVAVARTRTLLATTEDL